MTPRKSLALLALLAAIPACSKKPRPEEAAKTPPSAQPSATKSPPAPAPAPAPAPEVTKPVAGGAASAPCPAAEPLKALLAKAWQLDASRITEDPVCTPGHFPAPGFVVFGFLTDGKEGIDTFSRLAVVDASGTPLITQDSAPDKERLESTDELTQLAAADLDGDGVDEIVATHASAYKYSPSSESVQVFHLAGKKLVRLLDRGYAFTTADTMEGDEGVALCTGGWELTSAVPPALTVKGALASPAPKTPTPAPAGACLSGTETYLMKAGKLVKQ